MEQKESLTSLISTFCRAYHNKYDNPKVFNDYIAQELIFEEEFLDIKRNMIQGIQFFNKNVAQQHSGDPDSILKWITQVQLSPTPLARAAYCENVLQNELMLGLEQYVILGAGLDTFCFRHPELSDRLEIFEIDHPVTQAFKRKRLEDASLEVPNNLHFVSMDFTGEFSYQQLIEVGFENKKTLFSLLGVSYYLTKEENTRLLMHLFANVPSGSSIVFDYADENLFEEKGMSNRVENMVKMASASGEPMKSSFLYDEMESMLEKSGLLIYEHLSPTTINNRFFSNRTDYLSAFETVHFIHAVKQG